MSKQEQPQHLSFAERERKATEPLREEIRHRLAIFQAQGKREEQQDRLAVVQGSEKHPRRFAVVCLDGHGKSGGFIADAVLSAMKEEVEKVLEQNPLPTDALLYDKLFLTWDAVAQKEERRQEFSGGTTLTVVFVVGSRAFVAMLGDSEARQLHKDEREWVTKMTPHNPTKNKRDVQKIAEEGGKVSAQGILQDAAGHDRLRLTRGLGNRELEHLLKTPERAIFSSLNGRWLVVGSDGLWNALAKRKQADKESYQDVLGLIQRVTSSAEVSEILQNYLVPWDELGDNCTFSVIDLQISA